MFGYKVNERDSAAVEVVADSQPAGTIHFYIFRPGNNRICQPAVCKVNFLRSQDDEVHIEAAAAEENVTVGLDLQRVSNGFTGKFRAAGAGCTIVRLVWELPKDERGFPFVPAFMYGWNEGGKSPIAMYPQLEKEGYAGRTKPWVSQEWLVRTDRSSHGLTSVIADGLAYAVGGRDVCRFDDGTVAEKTGLGISSGNPHRLSFSLGFANFPYTYSEIPGRNFFSRPEGFVNLDKGTVASDIFFLLFNHSGRQTAAGRLLRESYGLMHDQVNDAGSVKDAIPPIADALVEYGYSNEAKNFFVTFYERMTAQKMGNDFSNAWAGGLRTAWPLLVAGRQFQNPRWLDCARSVFSNMAKNAISPKSGLFFENYSLVRNEWNTRGWWYGALEKPGHSAYVNGQMCHYLLLAYLAEKEAGTIQQGWLDAAQEVLDHVVARQGADGRFGYTYDEETGKILDDDGFCGCWFIPALAGLFRITGKKNYPESARRAMDFYRQFVKEFHVYGGPHDIYKSPDEEGILAWIDGARLLHEVTGEEQFLTDLHMGLDYEFSWKFSYNVVNEVEPLKSLNWCSTGGSVTSVNNSHIHPMGSAVAASILYAFEHTGDPYLRSRLIDTVRWTLTIYLHHDGQYGWGKRGMINERFCYTDSLLVERFDDGLPASTWFCAHSWASGAVLEGLAGKIYERSMIGDIF